MWLQEDPIPSSHGKNECHMMVCVCACVRACVCACVCVYVSVCVHTVKNIIAAMTSTNACTLSVTPHTSRDRPTLGFLTSGTCNYAR